MIGAPSPQDQDSLSAQAGLIQNSLDALEWPTLFSHITSLCLTPYGVQAWKEEPFLQSTEAIPVHMDEVDALRVIVERYNLPTLSEPVTDVTSLLRRLEKQGAISLADLQQLMILLRQGRLMIKHVRRYRQKGADADALEPLMESIPNTEEMVAHLNTYIDPEGRIQESASEKLARLMHLKRQTKQKIDDGLNQLLQNTSLTKAFQNTAPLERDGRRVLAVRIEFRSLVPGTILGTSSTGSTVYVEPRSIQNLSHQLQDLDADIYQEIQKVLEEISAWLWDEERLDEVTQFCEGIKKLDKRFAGAQLAKAIYANKVALINADEENTSPQLDLKQARHPLLILQEGFQKVVPNDVFLGQGDIRTMVITGPNTGGKTVILKTMGLLALMFRAGLPLPVGEQSSMSILDPVLADIGDKQSLSQNLSTFSAHLAQIKAFLSDGVDTRQGLILVDEIAAGTDPQEGEALSRAILQALYAKGGLTVVTTHLGDLKTEAHQQTGYMNASVEFDTDSLKPTYRLLMGIPGTSNAITIAQQLGIPESVITHARSMVTRPVQETSALIEELERKTRKIQLELEKAESFRAEAKVSFKKAETMKWDMEQEKRTSLKQFKASLKNRLNSVEKELKRLRKITLTEEVRDPEKLLGNVSKLERRSDDVFRDSEDSLQDAHQVVPEELIIGQEVFSKKLGVLGEVTDINVQGKTVTIQVGLMKMVVPFDDLQKPPSNRQRKKDYFMRQHKAQGKSPSPSQSSQKNTSSPNQSSRPVKDIDSSCDVRGCSVDEALDQVLKFLDDAMLCNYDQVSIIHGLGTGALKSEIRNYLSKARYIKRFYPAQATDGGDGKTIVEFKQ